MAAIQSETERRKIRKEYYDCNANLQVLFPIIKPKSFCQNIRRRIFKDRRDEERGCNFGDTPYTLRKNTKSNFYQLTPTT